MIVSKYGVRMSPTVMSSILRLCENRRYVFTREIVCYRLFYADDVYILMVYSGDEVRSLLNSCFDEVDFI